MSAEDKKIPQQYSELLAPYATRPEHSKGRKIEEPEHIYRSIYQRDRDRIIHSSAFRRLQYKTQVFVNHEGDHYRTRLTHTLEVVQIARTIAKALGLNEELVEAIALAHDLGHTPFGHAGEEALDEIMKDKDGSGFEHNQQGLRIVDLLEERYPNFKGLNLTWEVREGIIKHATSFDKPTQTGEFSNPCPPTLEAQVVNAADEIAYNNHDLDDGITSGLIKADLLNNIELWQIAKKEVNKSYTKLASAVEKKQIIRYLINIQVSELIEQSKTMIQDLKIDSPGAAKEQKVSVISFNNTMRRKLNELSDFLLKNLYRHFKVVRMSSKAQRFIREIFDVYLENPEQLPDFTGRGRDYDSGPLERIICDYIAGMTDRYALDEYKRLFHPWERV
ncbi:MAG: deoxyguanosinetriphosphate triphosphohydrolase [Candidatus Omnitrophica bacterium]|nr:deoxyguanosinetriphosphate triphosphohydrolase [Candidatus Omnitrophota bacterium]MBU1925068.1 deoxyguanosinetriphosphate triphosphohydrolase [Candidatus Omnitrophota bacterium]